MMHGFLCSAADIHDDDREMTLPAHRVLPVLLVTAAVFALCVCQGRSISRSMLIMQIVIDQERIMAFLYRISPKLATFVQRFFFVAIFGNF